MLSRLTSENADAYDHDAAGNLLEIAGAGPLDYDDAGQLLVGPVPPGSSSLAAEFDYDARGARVEARPLGGTATTYAYDQAERLTAFTPAGGATTTYAYDGSDLRVAKTTGGRTTRFTWDRSGSLPLLLGDDASFYVYGPGEVPIAHITSGGAVRYYHQDALGSTRALSDQRGATVGSFTYSPYGILSASSGAETTPIGYAGQQTDPESGLQYLRARYYDPATGQFLTRDPLTDLTGQPYGYADGDPVGNSDPTGLFWREAATRFVGAMDSATFGGTAAIRDGLGLNGGLDKCSFDYRAAGAIMDLTLGMVPSYRIGVFATKGPRALTWTWKKRREPGRDGGISIIGKERLGGETISQVHRVHVNGRLVHQHQNHIGKYGKESRGRQFPDEWVEYPRINAP